MPILLTFILALGIAAVYSFSMPYVSGTTWGASLQQNWWGMWLTMALIILVAIYLVAWVLGLFGKREIV
jgi:uncharacterized protein HemY